MRGIPKKEELVNTATSIKAPVTTFVKWSILENTSVITAVTIVTLHAMIMGMTNSIENESLGICSSIIAGRETNITNLFKIAADSSGKIRNLFNKYPMEIANIIKIKFSINDYASFLYRACAMVLSL